MVLVALEPTQDAGLVQEIMNIPWLLQSTAAAPGLAEGRAPDGLLNPVELAQLAGFRVVKRRRDWLLGRWTAKHLIQQHLAETTGERHLLSHIHIDNAADGAPFASLLRGDREGAPLPAASPPHRVTPSPCHPFTPSPLPLSLSISHSGPYGLCALWPDHSAQVGADIELVEPRDWSFVETFFSESELRFARRVIASERDSIVTAIWSAKEAVLKTLRTGLRADTRQITVRFPTTTPDPDRWTPLDLTLDPDLLPASRPNAVIRAWWRAEPGYVMTLALLSSDQTDVTIS